MYFKSIQFLRCFAAMYVTLYHLRYWWNQQQNEFTGIFDHGNGGVDLFFVISGFVIAQSAMTRKTGWYPFLVFLKKRAIRIFPLYWILLVAFLVPGMVSISGKTTWQCWQAFFLLPGHRAIIRTSWTLQYELYFYFLLGLLVLNRRFKYLLWMIVVLVLLSLTIQVTGGPIPFLHLPAIGLYNEIVAEFFLGILVWKVHAKVPVVLAIVLILVGAGLFFLPQQTVLSHFITLGIPAAMIITGLTALEKQGKLKMPAWLVLLGDASYCLYLLHYPLIKAWLPFPATVESANRWMLLGVVLVITCLAVVIHLFVEKPLLQLLNNTILPTKKGGR